MGQKGQHKSSPATIFMTSLRSRRRKARDPFHTCINDGHLAMWIALYMYIKRAEIIFAAGNPLYTSRDVSLCRRSIKVTLLLISEE